MNIEERLDFIEFRMGLLRQGTEFAKYLYDCNITEAQLKQLYDVMNYFRERIDAGENVSSGDYEHKVLQIVDRKALDYHFCEEFAELLWEEERYEEVFETLYKDSLKFSHLFKK